MYAASTTRLILFLVSRFTGELYYAIRVYNGSTEGRDSWRENRQADPTRSSRPDHGPVGTAQLTVELRDFTYRLSKMGTQGIDTRVLGRAADGRQLTEFFLTKEGRI